MIQYNENYLYKLKDGRNKRLDRFDFDYYNRSEYIVSYCDLSEEDTLHAKSIYFDPEKDINYLLKKIMKFRNKMIKNGTPTNIIHKFDKHFNIL